MFCEYELISKYTFQELPDLRLKQSLWRDGFYAKPRHSYFQV